MINYKIIINHLSDKQKSAIKNTLKKVASMWPSNTSLTVLAIKYGTDKWTHGYIPKYEKYFSPLRQKKLNILEIGIGGYKYPKAGGESLRMWKEYFPNSMIYGIDIYDKKPHEEERIRVFQGSQDDPEFLKKVVKKTGSLDLIIDDGSHVSEHVISSFWTLFPLLSNNGIYVIEDLQTSYIPKYGGSRENFNYSGTSVGFLKRLIDGLNYQWIKAHTPTYFDQNIVAMHFYPKIAFIFKGENKRDHRSSVFDYHPEEPST
jgi:hypothetical protein